MRKIKKGSSLVLVVIVLSILSILGTAITTLAVSNYKMRVLGSNKKVGQYSAESGIDEAYGMIGEMIDKAIEEATNAAKNKADALDLDNEIAIKEAELAAIERGETPTNTTDYINDDLTIKENFLEILSEKQNEEFQRVYKEYIVNELTNSLIGKLEDPSEYKYNTDFTKNPKVLVIEPLIDPSNPIKFNAANSLTIKLVSSFKYEGVEKILSAEYEVHVPEYKQSYYYESNHVKIPENILWTKAIAADGNMRVESKDVSINGDVFIKGKNSGNKGISLIADNSGGSKGKFKVNGNLITGENLSIFSKNSEVNISNNVYAKNVFIEGTADKIDLNVTNSVFTSDDLELNGSKSKIKIDGYFYGLDDGSLDDDSDPDSSSSIIINTDDLGSDSFLTINKAIIRGTSYINTSTPYQTGESLSVKGNYRAYVHSFIEDSTNPMNSKITKKDGTILDVSENKVYFDYYDPLTLVKGFKNENEFTAIDKAYYFKKYHESVSEFDFSGIEINDLAFATGSMVNSSGEIEVDNISLDAEDEIIKRREELHKAINNMGKNLNDESKSLETNIISVGSQVDFSKITSEMMSLSSGNEMIILRGSVGNYVLQFPGGSSNPSVISSNETITMNTDSNGKTKGVIIVNGNIYITGKMDFTGTIVASGHIIIEDNNEKTMNYDGNYVKQVIGRHEKIFNQVLRGSDPNALVDVQIDPKVERDSSMDYYIKKDNFIKLKNWKIQK